MTGVYDDDWSDGGLTRRLLNAGSDEDVLTFAQIQGRPLDPVVYRELCRRGLIDRLDASGRAQVPENER